MRYVLWTVGLLFGLPFLASLLVQYPVWFAFESGPLVLGASAAAAVCVAVPVGLCSVLALVRARNGHRRHTAWPVRITRLDALVWTMLPAAVLGVFAWPDLALLRDPRWGVFGAVGIPVLAPTLALLLPLVGLVLWQWLPAESVREGDGRPRFRSIAPGAPGRNAPWSGAARGAVREETPVPGELLLAPPASPWPQELLVVTGTARPKRTTSRLVTWLRRYVLFMAVLLALVAGLAAPADPRTRWYAAGEVDRAFVADGVAYVTYGREGGSLALASLDAGTGQENWRVPLPASAAEGHAGPQHGTKAEPRAKTSEADTVYVGGYAVNALATLDGSVRWTYPAPEATPDLRFGSPAVAGKRVLFTATDGTLRALDVKTGKLRWKKRWRAKAYGEDATYPLDSAPALLVSHGRAYVAQHDAVEVYDAASGGHRRRIALPGGAETYGTVLVTASADVVYAASGKTLSAYEGRSARRLWRTSLDGGSPRGLTVSGDSLFVKDEARLRRFAARSGKRTWDVEAPGRALPAVTGGHVVLADNGRITCFLVSSGDSCGTTSAAGSDQTLIVPDGSIMLVDDSKFVQVLSADLRPRDGWNARQLLHGWGVPI
ncbi:PQQ-binding-like beta-propeller repeat protein [Streptomyces sp. NPDC002599]|uniref:PQQ-binding-like beta-propeller repeat protein n=1 Tax=Streptomyces sp. NPDC002599 TaxID=3154421 RepID=UPI003326BB8E